MIKLKKAKPFVKWVGGKSRLTDQFEVLFPKITGRYFEPFVGSGAVFFYLWNNARLPKQNYLFDNNEELINTYLVVRDKRELLTELLAHHEKNHSKDYFYTIRNLDRQDGVLNDVERAARTLYLNRTCYNGLYRVNKKGQFNVPVGSYKNPRILFDDVLRRASHALKIATIAVRDFREIPDLAKSGDFFYFDPPYDPLSKTANFTAYTAGTFSDQDQRDLAGVYQQLSKKGCKCMLSNSFTPFVTDLYRDFTIKTVTAARAVNSDAKGRGKIKEVVVLNY